MKSVTKESKELSNKQAQEDHIRDMVNEVKLN